MRILFYSAYPGFSGSHKMALQLAEACQQAGNEVLVSAPANMEILDRAAAAGLETAVIPVHGELLQFGKVLLNLSAIGKLLFFVKRVLPSNLTAYRFLRSRKVDVVYAAQERGVMLIGLGSRLARRPLLWHLQGGLKSGSRVIHRHCNWMSSRIICVSQAVARTAEEAFGKQDASRLKVIPNGIPDLPPQPGLKEKVNAFGILFAGTLVPDKGVHHLISALSELPQTTTLTIAGLAQDDNYLKYLKFLAEQFKVAGRVTWLGYRDDLPDLIEKSDAVVCPSVERDHLQTKFGEWRTDWKEGFCLVALEAMRASKPVVVSDSYGLKEVVDDGQTGIRVPPGDAGKLATAIRSLSDDHETADRMGKAGRLRFENRFSIDFMVNAFLREFESLAPTDKY